MKNKLRLNLILILIIILIIIVVIICKYIVSLKKIEKSEKNDELEETIEGKVNDTDDFFAVEECINNYFETLSENNAEGVYSLLNNKYTEQNGINVSNVLQRVYQLKDGFGEFFAKDMYFKDVSYGKERQYYIYGEILGKDYNTIQGIYIIADLDFMNNTFDIILDEKTEINEQEYIDLIESLKNNDTKEIGYLRNTDNIKLNEYNKFERSSYDYQNEIYRYLKYYTVMAVYHPDIAYNLLDEEYRNKRFGSIESYKEYISNNEYKLLNSTVKQYNFSPKEGYDQYIITDTSGNYYIFKVTDIMKYTLLADYYTIEIQEIADKYGSASEEEKVVLNIRKVISALNSKDYKYVYDKLSQDFKASRYPTIDNFKNYISSIYPAEPEVSINKDEKVGDVYIYNVILQGSRASSANTANIQIIMQLKEDGDFVMSFNVQ